MRTMVAASIAVLALVHVAAASPAAERIAAMNCSAAAAFPNEFGGSAKRPFGIPIDMWTPDVFQALRVRLASCGGELGSSNARYVDHLEQMFGGPARIATETATGEAQELRLRKDGLVDEIAALEAMPQPQDRLNRMESIEQELDRLNLAPEERQEITRELSRQHELAVELLRSQRELERSQRAEEAARRAARDRELATVDLSSQLAAIADVTSGQERIRRLQEIESDPRISELDPADAASVYAEVALQRQIASELQRRQAEAESKRNQMAHLAATYTTYLFMRRCEELGLLFSSRAVEIAASHVDRISDLNELVSREERDHLWNAAEQSVILGASSMAPQHYCLSTRQQAGIVFDGVDLPLPEATAPKPY